MTMPKEKKRCVSGYPTLPSKTGPTLEIVYAILKKIDIFRQFLGFLSHSEVHESIPWISSRCHGSRGNSGVILRPLKKEKFLGNFWAF